MSHPTDLLAEFVAGTAGPHETEQVRAHLDGCAACGAEADAWRRLSTVVRASAAVTPPAPALLAGIRRRVAVVPRYGAPVDARPGRRALAVLARQVRLVRWPVWAVSAAVLVAAVAAAGTTSRLLAAVVPLAAALAVAGACGAGTDPADELVRSTITSPRVVLLARLTLVLGATIAAALAGTAVVALFGDETFGLVRAWLAPLVPLSALSFALAVLWRPAVGVGAALGLWCVRAVSNGPVSNGQVLSDGVSRLVEPVWTLDPTVLAVSVAAVAVTIFFAPRRATR